MGSSLSASRISICICTFRRPTLLAQLLESLAALQLSGVAREIEIIVADNDPANSAREVLQGWRAPPRFSLIALHVPQANISLARNATVSAAQGEWIAFIDDDETPQTDWLVQLTSAQQAHSADAVFAPVVPRYVPGTPAWIVQGQYFDRRRFPTGTRIDERDTRTGNVLISAALLKSMTGPFDADFGRTGGEDSLLFRDLLAKGAKFIWCDEAPVEEDVPLDRANAAWLLRRAYRIGQTWIRAEQHRRTGANRLAHGLYLYARALLQLLIALPLAAGFALWSKHRAFAWLRKAASQAGKLTGLSKFQYKEYGN